MAGYSVEICPLTHGACRHQQHQHYGQEFAFFFNRFHIVNIFCGFIMVINWLQILLDVYSILHVASFSTIYN
jgi:hypothetical protein